MGSGDGSTHFYTGAYCVYFVFGLVKGNAKMHIRVNCFMLLHMHESNEAQTDKRLGLFWCVNVFVHMHTGCNECFKNHEMECKCKTEKVGRQTNTGR